MTRTQPSTREPTDGMTATDGPSWSRGSARLQKAHPLDAVDVVIDRELFDDRSSPSSVFASTSLVHAADNSRCRGPSRAGLRHSGQRGTVATKLATPGGSPSRGNRRRVPALQRHPP